VEWKKVGEIFIFGKWMKTLIKGFDTPKTT
jgi:hypothetical protein